jgi:hypothetical protein
MASTPPKTVTRFNIALPLGVALHGVAIAAGFLVLLAAISTPPAFVGATAAMAGASILVTAKGRQA